MGRTFVIHHRCRIARQGPQPVAVAVGQVKRDLDPLPALSRNCLSLGLEFFCHQPIEQGGVFAPATVIALKEVMQHRATRRYIGINTHKDRAPVRHPDRGHGQHAPDPEWLLIPG